jgi:hypothetical protein
MARPRSVHSALGKRRTSTSVSPFFTAWVMMAAARLSASSSEMPDGFDSSSSSAFFLASACSFRRKSSLAFSSSAAATISIACFALGSSSAAIVVIVFSLHAHMATWRVFTSWHAAGSHAQPARSCFTGRTPVRQAVGVVDSSFELLQIDLLSARESHHSNTSRHLAVL